MTKDSYRKMIQNLAQIKNISATQAAEILINTVQDFESRKKEGWLAFLKRKVQVEGLPVLGSTPLNPEEF